MSKFLAKTSQKMREKFGKDTEKTQYNEKHLENVKQYEIIKKTLQHLNTRITKLLMPHHGSFKIPGLHMGGKKSAQPAEGAAPSKSKYPYEHGALASSINETQKDIDPKSMFAKSTGSLSTALARCHDADCTIEEGVTQNVLEKLKAKLGKGGEFEEIDHLLKKLEGRRLMYDDTKAKHSKGKGSVSDDDVRAAEGRFLETKEKCDQRFQIFFADDPERTAMICSFIEAEMKYHEECFLAFQHLYGEVSDVMGNPDPEYGQSFGGTAVDDSQQDFPESDEEPVPYDDQQSQPAAAPAGNQAVAIYDFDAEQETELSFRTGDSITLTAKLDENWLEGELNGASGIFPTQYVEAAPGVLESLPVPQ